MRTWGNNRWFGGLSCHLQGTWLWLFLRSQTAGLGIPCAVQLEEGTKELPPQVTVGSLCGAEGLLHALKGAPTGHHLGSQALWVFRARPENWGLLWWNPAMGQSGVRLHGGG